MNSSSDTENKDSARFLFYVPDFISRCERQALMKFFREYFEALDACDEISDTEIIRRKQFFVQALERSYRSLESHRNKFKTVLEDVTNKCIRPSRPYATFGANEETNRKTGSATV